MRLMLIFTCLFLLCLLPASLTAQVIPAASHPALFKHNSFLALSGSYSAPSSAPLLTRPAEAPASRLHPFSSGSVNDLPFFCAMECRVRKHANIWIKLRAGNDESYEKMIHQGKD